MEFNSVEVVLGITSDIFLMLNPKSGIRLHLS